MDRREFLATSVVTGAAAAALASEAMAAARPASFDPAAPLTRPRALVRNDTIGMSEHLDARDVGEALGEGGIVAPLVCVAAAGIDLPC